MWKKLNPWLLGLFAASFFAQNPDHYRHETTLALFALTLYLAIQIAQRVHFTAGCLFVWAICRGLVVFAWKDSLYREFSAGAASETCRMTKLFTQEWLGCTQHYYADTLTAFKFCSAETTACIALISFAALQVSAQTFSKILEAFSWLCIASGMIMIVNHNCSVLDNAAMDASFVVTLLPLVLFRKEFQYKALAIFPLIAIVKSGSSTGFLAVLVMLAAWYFAIHSKKWFFICTGGATALWFALWPVMPLRHELFNSYGRTAIWGDAWNLYKTNVHQMGGFGTGTYFLWGPIMRSDQLFIWLHNDWLQIGFEQGALGLVLALVLYAAALWRMRRHPWLFPILAATGFTMISQMPLRHVISAFYAAIIIRLAFSEPVSQPKKE